MKRLSCIVIFVLTLSIGTAHADVRIEIIDTGAGLATVTVFPDGSVMVYDTGHWSHDSRVFSTFQEIIGDRDIDLLIASHSDSDHIAATDELFTEYRVHRTIRTGMERTTDTWKEHDDAITAASKAGLTHDINLREVTLPHGTTFDFGGATVTYLVGFHEPPEAWGLRGSEFRNGNSIVMRVEYAGHSVLLTGDAVGREEGSPQDASAIATERYLIDNSVARPIESDVLVAPHHGSDDGSSLEFIREVGARWVVFSAGHAHEHPKQVTVERFLTAGYQPQCLLRTDLGDNEGGDEWSFGRTSTRDGVGDDGIEIVLPSQGDVIVRYKDRPATECEPIARVATQVPANYVKKSRSGICHTRESRWFERTAYFERFDDLADCIASGGRPL